MMAKYCGKAESTYKKYRNEYLNELKLFEFNNTSKPSLSFLSLSPPGQERVFAEEGAAQNQKVAIHYENLKKFYKKASWYLWIDVPEELQHPIWEEEVDPQRRGDGEY